MHVLRFACASNPTKSLGASFVSQINYRECKALSRLRPLCGPTIFPLMERILMDALQNLSLLKVTNEMNPFGVKNALISIEVILQRQYGRKTACSSANIAETLFVHANSSNKRQKPPCYTPV